MNKIFVILLLVTLTVETARAVSFDETTALGSQTFVQSVSGLGSFGSVNALQKSKAKWSLGYTFDRTRSVDPATNISIIDKTSQLKAGLGWKDAKNWSVGAALDYATTPEESLREFGPELNFGYKFYFQPRATSFVKKRSSDENFKPDVAAKLTFARLAYTQTFQSGKVRGRRKNTKPGAGKNQITQSLARLDVSSDVSDWFSVGLYASVYAYSRDVNQFIKYLDSSRSVAGQSSSGLSSTVSGLPNSEQGLDVQFYLSENWDLSARYSRSIIASDHLRSSTLKGEVSYDLSEKWTASLGAEYDHLVGFAETLGLLSFGYTL